MQLVMCHNIWRIAYYTNVEKCHKLRDENAAADCQQSASGSQLGLLYAD